MGAANREERRLELDEHDAAALQKHPLGPKCVELLLEIEQSFGYFHAAGNNGKIDDIVNHVTRHARLLLETKFRVSFESAFATELKKVHDSSVQLDASDVCYLLLSHHD